MLTFEKLSAQEIMNALSEPCFNLIIKNCLPSTNDYLLDLTAASKITLEKTAVLAEVQTGGRGRQGRSWVSPPGNIYLSVYWPFNGSHDALYGLSLVIGIAIARVLKSNGLDDVQLKWPNDIYWQAKKMGGILIETKPNKAGRIDVIVGIGLNIVEMPEQSQNITQEFVSLQNALNHKVSRNKLVAQLLMEISSILDKFEQEGFSSFVAEWRQLDAQIPSKAHADFNLIDLINYAGREKH